MAIDPDVADALRPLEEAVRELQARPSADIPVVRRITAWQDLERAIYRVTERPTVEEEIAAVEALTKKVLG